MKTLQLRNNPAYNEGNLLGHQVTNGVFGAVPLTFTRNSNGYILDTNGDKLRSANVPRIKSDGSVLLEPARTNLLTYSEQFDNAAWTKIEGTITPNAITSPNGATTADQFIESVTSNVSHGLARTGLMFSGTAYSVSYYVKYNNLRYVQIFCASLSESAYSAKYDLLNGVITNQGTSVTAKIEPVNNGYYRISMTTNALPSNTSIVLYTLDDSQNRTYTGSSRSLYIWGAQVEVGSYPTSYIPTTSSTITRVAESVSKTGIANLIGQSEGTIFFEGKFEARNANTRIALSDGTLNNIVAIGLNQNGNTQAYVVVGGVNQFVPNQSGILQNNTPCKLAFKYKENDFSVWLNGSKVLSGNSGSTFSGSVLNRFGLDVGIASNFLYGDVKQLALYTTALTDDELYNLTK